MNWTHPICSHCWHTRNEGDPVRLRQPHLEVCCYCDSPTLSGIYIRAHPDSVPYPAPEDEED